MIGVVTLLGAALWMREIASWRSHTLAKLKFSLDQLRFSRDGKFLLENQRERQGTILSIQNASFEAYYENVMLFDKNHGLQTFPCVWLNRPLAKV